MGRLRVERRIVPSIRHGMMRFPRPGTRKIHLERPTIEVSHLTGLYRYRLVKYSAVHAYHND